MPDETVKDETATEAPVQAIEVPPDPLAKAPELEPEPEVSAVPDDGVIRDAAGNAIREMRPDEVARAKALARKA